MRSVCHSLLFVPGNRRSRIAGACASGAHAVAVDLEDAVAESEKPAARETAVAAIEGLADLDRDEVALLVRVNGVNTPHLDDDVAALVPVLDRLDGLVLPKAESADEVHEVARRLDRAEADAGVAAGSISLLVTCETAAGVLAAREVASASPRVWTLLFGSADLSHELALDPTPSGEELRTARSLVVLGAAAAGRAKPLDGPYLRLDDDSGLDTSTAQARSLGFGGKAVIHPAQLATVHRAFRPSAEELAWAGAVDAAFTAAESQGVGSVRLPDGTFVDYPVAHRARALLRAAGEGARG